MKRTKIVCTVGPASQASAVLTKMIRAGMNVARFNFSHGEHAVHADAIARVRAIAKKCGEPVAILQDLQGPKIRLGNLPKDGVPVTAGKNIILTTDSASASAKKFTVDLKNLHTQVRKGDRILIDDGLIELQVKKITGHDILCEVENNGTLFSHKGVNFPDTPLRISSLTAKDKKDLAFGISQQVDYVALSFVRTAADVRQLRALITRHEQARHITEPTKIIVKIEKKEAVDNCEEIIQEADGIMIARGDLGVEMPAESVPVTQKNIIHQARRYNKPVIVATQMLDSMIRNPRPTRAEVSDVANAVIDYADAVMLSGETAFGAYPVEAVETMARIIKSVEASEYDDIEYFKENMDDLIADEVLSLTVNVIAKETKSKALIVASFTGHTGRLISKFRPQLPIYVSTDKERVRRQLNLSWGVIPFVVPARTIDDLVKKSIAYLKHKKALKSQDRILIVAGREKGKAGYFNYIKVDHI